MNQWVRVAAFIAIVLGGCGQREKPAEAGWVSLSEAEAMFGPLLTMGNHPTPNQNGTGERVGLFSDSAGTIWGLPVAVAQGGELRVCASTAFRSAGVTDTFPAGATIVGTANVPTGWRDGTGELELFFRDAHGDIGHQTVAGSHLARGPVCEAPPLPGPPQLLTYFRLVPGPRD